MDSFILVAFSTLITIVNPVGAVGPFLGMTADDSFAKRRNVALRACYISAATLAVCAAAGSMIFRFFGITIPALKIAGGILLLLVAIDMLYARQGRSKQTPEELEEGVLKDDIAVFPLAIPLLSGPGAIVSVFMLSDQASTSLVRQTSIYIAIAITFLVSYLVLSQAHRLSSLLGKIGMNILTRLMGLMLAAIAAQFVLDGLKAALPILSKGA